MQDIHVCRVMNMTFIPSSEVKHYIFHEWRSDSEVINYIFHEWWNENYILYNFYFTGWNKSYNDFFFYYIAYNLVTRTILVLSGIGIGQDNQTSE